MVAIRPWLALPGLLVAALVATVWILITFAPRSNSANVTLGDRALALEIADTPELRSRGLAGRSSIPENGGMLFLFEEPHRHTFWMKDMLISIDIIWIRDETIVSILHRVRPELGTPDERLARYIPPEPVDRVIELRAGRAEELGLSSGQKIDISLP